MRAPRAQLVALLILTLILGAVQCVASCTVESCNSSAPPCHQHSMPSHMVSSDCAHEFLLPDAHGSQPIHSATSAFVAPAVEIAHSFIGTESLTSQAFSPPDLSSVATSVLRI